MRYTAERIEVRPSRRFGPRYRERVVLPGGLSAWLRLLRRDDGELLRRAFARLSPESRQLRFFAGKAELSTDEWRYFLEVDGMRHFALVATRLVGGEEDVLGCARGILVEEGVWEATLTVVDHAQRLGVGRLLLERLMAAARERSLGTLRFHLMPANVGMRRLLARWAPEAAVSTVDGVARVEVQLASP